MALIRWQSVAMGDRLRSREGSRIRPRVADYVDNLRVWLWLYQARSATLPPAFLPWYWPNAWSGPTRPPQFSFPVASTGSTVPIPSTVEPAVRPGGAIRTGVQAGEFPKNLELLRVRNLGFSNV